MKAALPIGLLICGWLAGCALSPGQDIPSADTSETTGDGDPFPMMPPGQSPGGDGDISIGVPPNEGSCGLGGEGGEGGACPAGDGH